MSAARIQRHFFVCQNERPATGRPSCAARGAHHIRERLEQALAAHPELAATVSVTGCACLGPCFDGPMVVVYPEATWYAGVGSDDVAEIAASHLAGGVPVERLRYRFPDEESG